MEYWREVAVVATRASINNDARRISSEAEEVIKQVDEHLPCVDNTAEAMHMLRTLSHSTGELIELIKTVLSSMG